MKNQNQYSKMELIDVRMKNNLSLFIIPIYNLKKINY